MAEPLPERPDAGARLDGWKEIANYLGQSVRSIQRLEDRGLPVRRLSGGIKSRVFAFTAELDAWQRDVSVPRILDPAILQPVQEVMPRAAAIVEAADQPAEPSTLPTLLKRHRRRAGVLLLLLVTPVLLYLAHRTRQKPISDFRVQGRDLVAVDARGQEVWRHRFAYSLGEWFYNQEARLRLGWVGDLEGHGKQELVLAAKPVNSKEVGDHLFCFAVDGRIRWQFTLGRPIVDGGGSQMLPPYFTSGLQVIVGSKPTDTRIVVSSNHYLEQPNQVAFLDINGRVLGEYWHPGHLLYSAQADLSGRGKKHVLLAGVNNGDHQATLVVLDPLKVIGLVTPKEMTDHRFELLEMEGAKEEAVVLFPRSCIGMGQHYTRAKTLHVTKDRIVVEVAEGTTESRDPGFVYEFDYGLNVVNVAPSSDAVMRLHQQLEAQGKLNHPFFLATECERLKATVIVRRSH